MTPQSPVNAPLDRLEQPSPYHPALAALDAKLLRYGGRGDWPSGPWLLTGVQEWAVSTDGYALLAIHRDRVQGDCSEIPTAVAKLARKWIAVTLPTTITVGAERLRSFAGIHQDAPFCATCDGEGTVECPGCDGEGAFDCECSECSDIHERDCRRCDGSGEKTCPACGGKDARPKAKEHAAGQLLGQLVNRRILASVLTVAQDDEPVSVAVDVASDVFLLRGGVWFAIVMALRKGSMEPEVTFDAGDTAKAGGNDPVEPTKAIE